ncbi:MAG: hypothetical protein QOF66_7798 [Mycobacterium sp.]|jgi:hypothetical protein|nr:hypothetical protein [Mycobacterium sp.]
MVAAFGEFGWISLARMMNGRLALPGCGSPGSWVVGGRVVVRLEAEWPRRERRRRRSHRPRARMGESEGVVVGRCG